MGKLKTWEDITDILTPEGAARLQVGQVLLFNFEGSPIHLKVKRKSHGKVWVARTHLYTEEEIRQLERAHAVRSGQNKPRKG